MSLANYSDTKYYELPITERADVAIVTAGWTNTNEPALFKVALQPGPIPSAAIMYRSALGTTLLHAVARAIAKVVKPFSCNRREDWFYSPKKNPEAKLQGECSLYQVVPSNR